MKIEGNKPDQGSEVRRFSAGRGAPKDGAKSFGALLKKAEASAAPSEHAAPAPVPAEAAKPIAGNAAPEAPPVADGDAKAKAGAGEAKTAEPETSFADHMEMVRFRLKTGYYSGKAIDDALSEKLSGYFDELA